MSWLFALLGCALLALAYKQHKDGTQLFILSIGMGAVLLGLAATGDPAYIFKSPREKKIQRVQAEFPPVSMTKIAGITLSADWPEPYKPDGTPVYWASFPVGHDVEGDEAYFLSRGQEELVDCYGAEKQVEDYTICTETSRFLVLATPEVNEYLNQRKKCRNGTCRWFEGRLNKDGTVEPGPVTRKFSDYQMKRYKEGSYCISPIMHGNADMYIKDEAGKWKHYTGLDPNEMNHYYVATDFKVVVNELLPVAMSMYSTRFSVLHLAEKDAEMFCFK